MRAVTIAANQGAMGGGEVMLLAIAEAARSLGRDVTVVAPASPDDVVDEATRRGFRVVAIDSPTTASYLVNLRRWDARHRRGLLWCNGLRPALATAGHPHRAVELHQRPEGKLKALAAVARRGALAVVVPSRNMADAVRGATVLWNWTEPFEVVPPSEPRTPTRIGFIGRFSADKGVVTLREAIAAIEARHPGRVQLVLAGEERFTSDADRLAVQAAIAGLGPVARRIGWVDRQRFFAEVDVAVFPSQWPEPFGLVVAEAMHARVPFVISDAGALREVAGRDYPFVARAADAASLAETIERLLDDGPGDWPERCRTRWEREFSPEAGQRRLGELLDRFAPLDATPTAAPRVALAHDYLTQRGGAERVTVAFTEAFPGARLSTSLYEPDATFPEFADVDITTSPLNRIGLLRRHFRVGLPLYGWAFDRLPVDPRADVVLASTTAFAHGIRARVPKIVYCHSPGRFLYLADDYLGAPWWRSPSGIALAALRPALVRWDQRAAKSADLYLCNSTIVRQRIKDVYGIDARVLHPPYGIDVAGERQPIAAAEGWPAFHLVVSRLMPYKNVDAVVEAFRSMPERHLLIVGRGPLAAQLRASLPGNVALVEDASDAQLRWAYAHATALIAASKEDFGLTPVEAFAFGTPALALRAGGYLDSVREGVSGWFFDAPTPAAIADAVAHLDAHPLDPDAIVRHAEAFSPASFAAELRRIVAEVAR